MEKRANFGSKLGIILASAGSAVGLGNVWRFPTEVGENGGAAFILIYILCVILLGVPLMVSEFVIGRHTHKNTADAYQQLAPHSPWVFQGYLGVFTSWFILCYYSVVAGWTLKYLFSALAGQVGTIEDSAAYFTEFTASPWLPLLCMVAVMLMCHWVIARGVQAGIEKYSKLMMPLLLLIIAVLVVCSFSMPGSDEGLRFLFKPDFSKIDSSVVLSAMGQAFFSLSIAMGCLCTYASYFRDDAKLVRTAGSVAVIDTTVAIMSGFIIFPAVFSVAEVAPDAGPGLVFITLPNVFQIAFGHVPFIGWLFAVMFYLLLLLAALTSMMSIHEPTTAFLLEHFHLQRSTATWMVTLSCILIGVLCCLSFGPLADVKVLFGMTFFDFFDFVSAKIFLPLGGIIISLFVGWKLDRQLVYDEVTNRGTVRFLAFPVYRFILRWLAPIAIGLIFLNELGVLKE
ncbi:MAG: sodium-dependent transporter [Bacteroidaceae bacterium]|nr:sodium-dependent transporter [Bacteroidaceae bacterium]MBQ8936160.1 sodium-dependent transporter [Bacteroidaceae bacterium]MBQ9191202.1 sodium-dependent transporter [Bacteroidaceae bacterium]